MQEKSASHNCVAIMLFRLLQNICSADSAQHVFDCARFVTTTSALRLNCNSSQPNAALPPVWTTSSTYIRGTVNVAPHARGLPLVGGTLSLALQGADFIHTCRKRVRMDQWVASSVSGHSGSSSSTQRCLQYGDIVRVSLGGQRMTYLFSPDAMKLFFSASDDQIGFRQACSASANSMLLL